MARVRAQPSPETMARRRALRSVVRRDRLGLVLAAIWFVAVLVIGPSGEQPGDLTTEASRMLAIFGAAVVLWVTEAIPLAATSIAVILAMILLISDQAIIGTSAGFDAPPYASFYATLAHPVLILFLGGFILAQAAARYRLDRALAGVLLAPFARSSAALVGGLMVITAVLSMFMSNTATTAAMLAVVLPVAARLDRADPLRVGIVLCVPIAANVGGIGTPVGSPPNAIALGRLADEGIQIDFLKWMLLAVPIAAITLGVSWLVITRRYRAVAPRVDFDTGEGAERSRGAVVVAVVFGVTVLGWMTEPIHGIPSAIVGFVPVVVLLATKVVGVDDLRQLDWHVLWLVGGGIALGNGVSISGLDAWIVGLVDWGSFPTIVITVGLAVLGIALSTVISNSATANLIVPIGVGLAASAAVDLEPILAGVVIALACSLAMALPVSTPPNAVAYASGNVDTKDLAIVGGIVGAVGLFLVLVVAPPFWRWTGLL